MARQAIPPDLRLLSKVSKLYYERHLNQNEIAERLHLSRPKVSRLLQQAQDEGIVQITVMSPPGIYADLEQQLEERFGLREAVVVEVDKTAPQEVVSREVGTGAGEYFQRTLSVGDIIGISWGMTLVGMVNALPRCEIEEVHVVQIIGGLGPPEAEVHATNLCRRLSYKLSSKLTLIPAPGIASTNQARAALETDSHVQNALALFERINVAYVGIGVPSPTSVTMRDGSILTAEDLERLRAHGAVGDIALRYFDGGGQAVASELDERVVGITLQQLRQIETVVGVAGGQQKEAVVRAALHGRLINVLITDQLLAARLLDL